MRTQRLMIFIDAQNFYQGARRAFFSQTDDYVYGQFDPVQLGRLICSRPVEGETRVLQEVRVYTGQPDSTRDPKGYSANRRQCAAWEKRGARVIWRTLRYPHDWPRRKEEEKGIDVALAIDFIAAAIDRDYDVGVIASVDTDLIPALEFVLKRHPDLAVEVAAWRSETSRGRLSIPGASIMCHWLHKSDYDLVADLTDYAPRPRRKG